MITHCRGCCCNSHSDEPIVTSLAECNGKEADHTSGLPVYHGVHVRLQPGSKSGVPKRSWSPACCQRIRCRSMLCALEADICHTWCTPVSQGQSSRHPPVSDRYRVSQWASNRIGQRESLSSNHPSWQIFPGSPAHPDRSVAYGVGFNEPRIHISANKSKLTLRNFTFAGRPTGGSTRAGSRDLGLEGDHVSTRALRQRAAYCKHLLRGAGNQIISNGIVPRQRSLKS